VTAGAGGRKPWPSASQGVAAGFDEGFPSSGWELAGDFDVIQRLVDGDFAEHHDLGDAQCGFAVRGVEHGGEVEEHFAGGAEGFAGVGEQGFAVVLGVGEVHAFGLLGAGHDLAGGFEVMVEGAFGGFVESLGVGGFVGGCGVGFWWVGCWFDHGETPS